VLGALNAATYELITVTNETYITAESVCHLLVTLAEQVGQGAITVVLDNARYQKCAIVQQYAAALGIELLYLPSYSPQLNLIERMWRFIRKKCLYSKYYPDFSLFKQAIEECIRDAPAEHREELESLLSWKFQSFEKVQISAV
jgi:transposase